ncbi:MAG TPA: DUF1801 domain-containing protein [Candidatus Nanoarchaeia archaeon]|nr:DUF1801 domain-containing protein [Candidatus Nanoarchaeia archaeon]
MVSKSVIDEYIGRYPSEVQRILKKIKKLIKSLIPEAEEKISYGIPTFDLEGKHIVHFAAFKNHISLFPTSAPIELLKDELKGYKISKGTIQFPLDKPIPYDLIERIVKFRIENTI